MELRHFKWDAQVGDVSSLAPYPILFEPEGWASLARAAEALAAETESIEAKLRDRRDLDAQLGLPRPLRALFARGGVWSRAGARVLRFDFHWTTEGWRVSEVNSDVPGGYTEATCFTGLVAQHLSGAHPAGDPTAALVDAIVASREGEGPVALTSAPGHMEDYQVVAHLAHRLRERGIAAELAGPAHLRWTGGRASLSNASFSGEGEPLSAVFRFYQVEWLAALREASDWPSFFVGSRTPITNPGSAALTESKRLPLVWERLGLTLPTWRRFLPETRALHDAPWSGDDGWLIKHAFSNTGDTVSIRGAECMASAELVGAASSLVMGRAAALLGRTVRS